MKPLFKPISRVILLLSLILPASMLPAQSILQPSSSVNTEAGKENPEEDSSFFVAGIDKLSASFFARLAINLLSALILLRFIYYPIYRKKDFFFTFFLFNIVIFVLTYLLNKVELSMGAAFGLFAVFSLLRYRTENISAKDMTYLFVVIALGLITAVNKGTFVEAILINGIILTAAYAMDASLFMKNENTKMIQYENIELIRPENHLLLLEDLKKRTGLNIHKISVTQINFLRDTATVIVHYYDSNKPVAILPAA